MSECVSVMGCARLQVTLSLIQPMRDRERWEAFVDKKALFTEKMKATGGSASQISADHKPRDLKCRMQGFCQLGHALSLQGLVASNVERAQLLVL